MSFGRGVGSYLLTLLVSFLLAGCQAPAPAPVSELRPPPSQRIMHHVVSRGETLYAIAWRYELDVEKLAAANGLASPYQILPGQRLSLDTSKSLLPPGPRPKAPSPVVTASASKPPVNGGVADSSPGPVPGKPAIPLPAPVQKPVATPPSGTVSWRWPVKGKVTREYDSSRVFKGISIQSTPGRDVLAAAPGVVVYAGEGLRGYGQLIIIKHSDTYLSAYAHNRKILVREGVVIARNQKVSEVGGDPQNRGRLYFEIRRNGKPIDPMRLLPRQ